MRSLSHVCGSIGVLVLLAGSGLALGQVEPPDMINYQGVLRDAAGHPLSGNFEMIFRFFDAASGPGACVGGRLPGAACTVATDCPGGCSGNGATNCNTTIDCSGQGLGKCINPPPGNCSSELARDERCAGGGPAPCTVETGAVTVTNGLFNVEIGGSDLIDGPGGVEYTGDLPGIFRDHKDIWLRIEIYFPGPAPPAGFQVLSPTVKVNSSAYSLNSNHLDGFASTAFPKLTVGNTFSTGTQRIQTGAAATKGLIVQGAPLQTSNLQEWQDSGSTVLTSVTPSGAISWPGFGSSATANATGLILVAGSEDTDSLTLAAGNNGGAPNDGRIILNGAGNMVLQTGGLAGDVVFENGNGTVESVLDEQGNLQINGQLQVWGGTVWLDQSGFGPRLFHSGNEVGIMAAGLNGAAELRAGPGASEGAIVVNAGSAIQLYSGDGYYAFNENTGSSWIEIASVSGPGNLQIDGDLTVSGNDVTFQTTTNSVAALHNSYDMVFRKDEDNDNVDAWFRFFTDAGSIENLRIVDGNEAVALFDGLVTANGIDYAEAFKVADPTLAAGEVVSFAFDGSGEIRRSAQPYDPNLAGVVSEKPGFVTGNSFDAEEQADPEIARQRAAARAGGDSETEKALTLQLMDLKNAQHRPVALAGRVPVKVDASYGAIQPGDHLTSSPTPGHAMIMKEPGVSLGIALEGFAGPGTGNVLVFVDRSYYTPPGQLEKTQAAEQKLAGQVAERTADPVTGVQTMDGNLQIVLDKGGDDQSRLSVFRDGEGTLAAEVFRVDEDGNVYARGSFRPASLDLAEYHPVTEPVEVGDVLVVDRNVPGSLKKGNAAADPAVVGIVSAEPGVLMGSGIGRIAAADADLSARLDDARRRGDRGEEAALWKQLETRFGQTHAAVALSGTVPCKVDATYGSIRVGDLLTASPTSGRAMRSADGTPGTILGKALEPLEAGTGTIKVLVMLH